MFTSGQTVYCVNINNINTIVNSQTQQHLTIGNQYKVHESVSEHEVFQNSIGIPILNDIGEVVFYNNTRFVSVSDYRKLKIEKILKSL